jgi:hypothetical protein
MINVSKEEFTLAFIAALNEGNIDIARLIFEKGDIDYNRSVGTPVLNVAIYSEEFEIAEMLLNKPDINTRLETEGGLNSLDACLEKAKWFKSLLKSIGGADFLKKTTFKVEMLKKITKKIMNKGTKLSYYRGAKGWMLESEERCPRCGSFNYRKGKGEIIKKKCSDCNYKEDFNNFREPKVRQGYV